MQTYYTVFLIKCKAKNEERPKKNNPESSNLGCEGEQVIRHH
jgi:hypothetical protein